MKLSATLSPKFSHIYIEERAVPYQWAQKVLNRFPEATVIRVGDYKELFARTGQNYRLQKAAMNLILAAKKDRFLYPGSPNAQSFGLKNFHYNALILNCLYDCAYCYLQGMYPSPQSGCFRQSRRLLRCHPEGPTTAKGSGLPALPRHLLRHRLARLRKPLFPTAANGSSSAETSPNS